MEQLSAEIRRLDELHGRQGAFSAEQLRLYRACMMQKMVLAAGGGPSGLADLFTATVEVIPEYDELAGSCELVDYMAFTAGLAKHCTKLALEAYEVDR